MKSKKIKNLVIENIIFLIPLILYGIYKNGFLLYEKNLISLTMIFKPIFLVLIGVIIKIIIDLIIYKKIIVDYNFLYVILIAMIMPYNINLIIFSITLLVTYLLSLFLEKHFKFNKVCAIYLIIILINSLFNNFTFLNIQEEKYTFSFSFFDLLIGRNIGGISTTSIIFVLLAYIYFTYSIYYKKDIPLVINIVYLIIISVYYVLTQDNSLLLNSELIFASVFVANLPEYSPYKVKWQIAYSIFIGIIASIISIFYNPIIGIYIGILLASLILNIKIPNKINLKN